MVENVIFGGKIYAIIIGNEFKKEGVSFLTPNEFSQQLAYMQHKKGKTIVPHIHNPVPRDVTFTLEALFIRKGRLRVDFYDDNRNYLDSRELTYGDVILLTSGGHGFEVLEDLEMIEVKQGPYTGDMDKIKFEVGESH